MGVRLSCIYLEGENCGLKRKKCESSECVDISSFDKAKCQHPCSLTYELKLIQQPSSLSLQFCPTCREFFSLKDRENGLSLSINNVKPEDNTTHNPLIEDLKAENGVLKAKIKGLEGELSAYKQFMGELKGLIQKNYGDY